MVIRLNLVLHQSSHIADHASFHLTQALQSENQFSKTKIVMHGLVSTFGAPKTKLNI